MVAEPLLSSVIRIAEIGIIWCLDEAGAAAGANKVEEAMSAELTSRTKTLSINASKPPN